MRVMFSYQQRACMLVEGTLEVPADVVEKGPEATKEWVQDHESDCTNLDWDLLDWDDRVDHTFKIEEL